MTQRARRTIGAELLQALNSLANDPMRSELDLARIMRNAQSLRARHAAEFFMIEGICESLRGRAQLVRSAFEKAIAHGGWNQTIAENYAISLHDAGDVSGAWDVIQRGLEHFDSDQSYLCACFSVLLNTGNLPLAATIEQRLLKMGIQAGRDMTWRDFLDAMEEGGQSAEGLGEVIRIGKSAVRENHWSRRAMYYSFTTADGGAPHLIIGLNALGSDSEIHDLELRVHDRVYRYVDELETQRLPGEASLLDWFSIHLRSEHGDDNNLHPA